MRGPVLALVLAATASGTARGEPVSPRPVHWSLGGGGTTAITGSETFGSLLDAEVYPGGRFGRLGARVSARGDGTNLPDKILAGITFEAAAARPRLQLALYAELGASTSGDLVFAAGVQTQLWIIGPLAASLEGGGVLIVRGTENTELRLGGALTMRLGR